jgi:t-SNARE complex subunit (syntaxin)
MSEKTDLEFSVSNADGDRVFVEQFDDGVWLAIHHRRGTANTVLTKAQAREMIAALMLIVEAD